jgi:hypothetical protein
VTHFDDAYTIQFEALASALATGDTSASRRLVELLAAPGALMATSRPSPSIRRWAAVFARDSYTCRYCARRTLALPVLRAVSKTYPALFRFHPNWKASETDTAYLVLSTSADHVMPVTRGGDDSLSNLVTACWRCNETKGNFLLSELRGWELLPPASTAWRGLTEYLEPMMTQAGLGKDPYLRRWSDAIHNPEPLSVTTESL